MPRYSKKSHYTVKNNLKIYILSHPITKEFYIGHCAPSSLLSIFRQHCAGKNYQTKTCFEILKSQNLHPCLHVLEDVNLTKTEAYSHLVAWLKILLENGYTNLNKGNINKHVTDLNAKTHVIYDQYKDTNLSEILNCKTCIVSTYGRKNCTLNGGNKDE